MRRPLRFCFLTTFYPPFNFGGDGIAIRRLARGLVRRGHHVTVIHDVDAYGMLSDDPLPETPPPDDGVEAIGLRSGLGPLSPFLTQQTGRPLVNGPRIRRILDAGRFDVVNFHNVSLVGGPGLLSYGRDSIRIYTAHEHWLVCPMHILWRHARERCDGRQCIRCTLRHGRPPQLHRFSGFHDRQLAKVDAYIAFSEFSRDKHHEFGFPHEMEVLPAFLPDEDAEPDGTADGRIHPRPYFLFVGRLEEIKGLQDVIPAFEAYEEADLLVAGDGGYADVLRARASGNERVRFLGRVPPDDLRRYYRDAVALIAPSICFETFGIVLIEAFRQGTPVIARKLGPFPEIVRQASGGELFETRQELVEAMGRMQEEPAHRDALGRSGREAFRARWVESAVIPRYLDIVRRTARKTGRTSVERALRTAEAV